MNQETSIMNNAIKGIRVVGTFLILYSLFLIPSVYAAVLYVDAPERIAAGEEFEVAVMLDAEGESLNAIEGILLFSDTLEFRGTVESGSLVPLWIERPKEESGAVIFSGIIPGGFEGVAEPFEQKLLPGRVFTATFLAREAGDATFSFPQLRALRNEPEATPAELRAQNTDVSVFPQQTYSLRSFIVILLLIFIISLFLFYLLRQKMHNNNALSNENKKHIRDDTQ